MKDLKSNIKPEVTIAPAGNRNASVNGTGIDLQGFHSAAVTFAPATITDGTHTPKLQESDDNSTFTDVAAADQLGTLAALASDTVQTVGYKGGKRYIRGVVTVAGATTGGIYAAMVIKGHPDLAPTA
ncbi:MAG: hypothetical protein ACOY8P_07950 [Thermodesulfobacteriota bacterium]|jgi:hypothetical protein